MSHVICQSLATFYKDYLLVEGIHSNPEQLLNRFFLKPTSQPIDTQSSGTHQLICLTKSVTEHVLDHFIVGVWWIFIRSLGGIVISVLSLSHHISKKSYEKHLPLFLVLYLYLLAHISIKTNHRGYWKGGTYGIKKIVQGTFHQGNTQFEETASMQCTSNGYIIFSAIKKVSLWKAIETNYILDKGNALFKS